jgi:Fur family peroxide stress response transcriptional regulator
MEKIKEILEKKGIKPSIQRIKIFECLMRDRNHPTAKDIYEMIFKEIPTLSKTTIYNTVKLFTDKGILKPVRIREGEVRYDIEADFHPHFRCRKCGRIFDLDEKLLEKDKGEIGGHLIEERCVCYLGICKNCRKN